MASTTVVAHQSGLFTCDFLASKECLVPKPSKLPTAFNSIKPYELIVKRPEYGRPLPKQSTTLLSLPTKLRLQIYTYLMNNDDNERKYLRSQEAQLELFSARSAKYAYLYRSPSRSTKPNSLMREVLNLFHICRRIRQEAIDVFFGARTFVLEASLYQKPVGGLKVLPLQLSIGSFVRRLLLITFVELDGRTRGIADLCPIQEMTTLKELRIVFVTKSEDMSYCTDMDMLDLKDNPIKAIMECVPESTHISFGASEALEAEMRAQLGPNVEYIFEEREQRSTAAALRSVDKHELFLSKSKGRLSGSETNHSFRQYHKCLEGLDCVNSRFNRPLPAAVLHQSPVLYPWGHTGVGTLCDFGSR